MSSALVQSLPKENQDRMRQRLQIYNSGNCMYRRDGKFRMREAKWSTKRSEIRSLLALNNQSPKTPSIERTRKRIIKPGFICNVLNVKLNDVQSLAAFKPRPPSIPLYCDPTIIQAVGNAIKSIGMKHSTIKKVSQLIQNQYSQEWNQVPKISTIRRILQDQFDVGFKTIKQQNIKYIDQQFDSKRLLVSRLLA